MLTIGRMSRGKSIRELASLCGCASHVISYAENKESIKHETLLKIANILDYPESFFTRQDRAAGMYGLRGQKAIRKLFQSIYWS